MHAELLIQELADGAELRHALLNGVTPEAARYRPGPESWFTLEVVKLYWSPSCGPGSGGYTLCPASGNIKSVNDSYGHLVGDRMLSLVSKNARSVSREGDVLVRYGGDEFAVILPSASKQDTYKIGERLRRLMEDSTLSDGEQAIRATISLGGRAYPELDVSNQAFPNPQPPNPDVAMLTAAYTS